MTDYDVALALLRANYPNGIDQAQLEATMQPGGRMWRQLTSSGLSEVHARNIDGAIDGMLWAYHNR